MSAKPDMDMTSLLQNVINAASGAKARSMPGWWNSFQFHETLRFDVNYLINFARSAMFTSSLAQGGTVYESEVFMALTDDQLDLTDDQVDKLIENFRQKADLRLIYAREGWFSNSISFFVSKSMAIQMEVSDHISATIVTVNKEELASVKEVMKNCFNEQVET